MSENNMKELFTQTERGGMFTFLLLQIISLYSTMVKYIV